MVDLEADRRDPLAEFEEELWTRLAYEPLPPEPDYRDDFLLLRISFPGIAEDSNPAWAIWNLCKGFESFDKAKAKDPAFEPERLDMQLCAEWTWQLHCGINNALQNLPMIPPSVICNGFTALALELSSLLEGARMKEDLRYQTVAHRRTLQNFCKVESYQHTKRQAQIDQLKGEDAKKRRKR